MVSAERGGYSPPAEKSASLSYPVPQGRHEDIHMHNIRQTVSSAMKHTHKHMHTCVCMHAHAATIEEKNKFEREQGECTGGLGGWKEWEEMI